MYLIILQLKLDLLLLLYLPYSYSLEVDMPQVQPGQVCSRQVCALEPGQFVLFESPGQLTVSVVFVESSGQLDVPELPAESVLGPAPGGGGQQGVDHVTPG